MNLRKRFGFWRSIAIYYLKPFNKRRLMRFYSQFVNQGDLCFDIGAHVGNRTQAFLALGAKVVAVEPQPMCYDYLQKRFGRNNNCKIVTKAIADSSGPLTMYISHAAPTISTLSNDEWRDQVGRDTWFEVQWEEELTVESITLDDLIDEFGMPAFCKIDVENFEARVLSGLSKPIQALSFEYYPPFTLDTLACIDHLDQLAAYEYNWSFGESQKFNSDSWVSAEEMKDVIGTYSSPREYGDIYARLSERP